MPWTTEQKIFIVEAYFRENSIHAAQLQFKKRFGCREFPVHSMIYRWVNKFRTHGTLLNLNRKDTNRQSHSGRPKSLRALSRAVTSSFGAPVQTSIMGPHFLVQNVQLGYFLQYRDHCVSLGFFDDSMQ